MTALALDAGLTVRERLRAATDAAHRRLDAHPLLAAMLEGTGGLAPYQRMLQAYAPLYARLDAAIAAAAPVLPTSFEWRARLKSDWLRRDLAFFGLPPSPGSRIPPPPDAGSAARLVGVLYPVEGSTLGARMILTRLGRHFAIDERNGGRFLAGYRGETARRWQASCAWFETIAGDEAAIVEAIAAARAVFACFEAALDAAARD